MKKFKSVGIYCIGESEEGPCKIGIFSNKENRLAGLQCGNPRKLNMYFHVETEFACDKEKYLHRLFKPHKMVGEWFAISAKDIVSEIERVVKMDRDKFILIKEKKIKRVKEEKNQNIILAKSLRKSSYIQIRVDEIFKAAVTEKAKHCDMKISEIIVKLLQKWSDE